MASIFKGPDVDLERWIIANSVTIKKGDFVKIINAGLDIADAVSDVVYGICEGIVTNKGVPLNQANSSDYSGTYTAATEQYAAAADNLTVSMVHALVRPVYGNDIISVEMDAAVGTTTGSNKPGYYVDVLTSNASKLDESNTHASNVLQFITVDNGQGTGSNADPVKGGNFVLVKVRETQTPAGVQG